MWHIFKEISSNLITKFYLLTIMTIIFTFWSLIMMKDFESIVGSELRQNSINNWFSWFNFKLKLCKSKFELIFKNLYNHKRLDRCSDSYLSLPLNPCLTLRSQISQNFSIIAVTITKQIYIAGLVAALYHNLTKIVIVVIHMHHQVILDNWDILRLN